MSENIRKRDPKDLYKKFDNGEITQVAGLDLSIDEPEAPDWIVNFDSKQSPIVNATNLIVKWELENYGVKE